MYLAPIDKADMRHGNDHHRADRLGQEGDEERSREAGCDGHLVKPVNIPTWRSS
jgi:hypothetical protein